jgi:hypothetical protein
MKFSTQQVSDEHPNPSGAGAVRAGMLKIRAGDTFMEALIK